MEYNIITLMLKGATSEQISHITGEKVEDVEEAIRKFGGDIEKENGNTPVFSEEQRLGVKLMILDVFDRTISKNRAEMKKVLLKEVGEL